MSEINNLLKSECSVLTHVYETTNYNLFGFIKGNRNILPSHVNKIKKSIKNKHIKEVAIIVVRNPNFSIDGIPFLVVDGQHRFTGIKDLKIPLTFVIADSISEEEILNSIELLNTNSKDWEVTNFMGSKCELGNVNYINYKSLFDKYDFEHEIFFYTMKKMGISMDHSKFKEGLLTFTDETRNNVNVIFEWLEKYLPIVDNFGKRYYLKSLIDLYYLDGIDIKRLNKVIIDNKNELIFSGSIPQSLNHLVYDLYNHGLRKDKVSITPLDRSRLKYRLNVEMVK
jgi:hypothetical protein